MGGQIPVELNGLLLHVLVVKKCVVSCILSPIYYYVCMYVFPLLHLYSGTCYRDSPPLEIESNFSRLPALASCMGCVNMR